jgi:hypothetical protein
MMMVLKTRLGLGLAGLLMWVWSYQLGAFELKLSLQQLEVIAKKIEHNETGGQDKFLLYWSEAEEFPSFGIGHFIWIPENVDVPFESTFYSMQAFVSAKHPAPNWVNRLKAPWSNRAEFQLALQQCRLEDLRVWLLETKPLQAEFIVSRFEQRLAKVLNAFDPPQRESIKQKIQGLALIESGVFAMVDYANFKGFGDHPHERYQGEGWGLIQVLESMPAGLQAEQALEAFVRSAKNRLDKRIALSPLERNEMRWRIGWHRRLDQYQSVK